MFTARYGLDNSTFCPHSVFVCFAWIREQTAIISLYSISWLVFITETVCLLRCTDWVCIYNSTFRPHRVFMCFVWIWEQTAIMYLYRINLSVFITEAECLLRGTDWVFNHLNADLNPIFQLLALIRAHRILHISRVRVKSHIYFRPLKVTVAVGIRLYSVILQGDKWIMNSKGFESKRLWPILKYYSVLFPGVSEVE